MQKEQLAVKQTIKVKTDEQIKLITPILILNGYTVRKTTVTKPNSKTKQNAYKRLFKQS